MKLKLPIFFALCLLLITSSRFFAQNAVIAEVSKLVAQGEKEYQANNLPEAERLFTQAIELEDKNNFPSVYRNPAAYLGLSSTLTKRHPYRGLQTMLRWFNFEASNPAAYRAFAKVAAQTANREQDAVELNFLTEAVLLEPNNPENYMLRAKYLRSYVPLMLEEYERLIEVAPKYAPVYLERGNIQFLRGEYDLAIADFDKYIALNPQDEQVYNLRRGIALLLKEDADGERIQQAIQHLTKAIAGSDAEKRGEAFYYRGWGNFLARNRSQAQADMTEAANLNPKIKNDFYYRLTFEGIPDNKYKDTKSLRKDMDKSLKQKDLPLRERYFIEFKFQTAAVSLAPEDTTLRRTLFDVLTNMRYAGLFTENPYIDLSLFKKGQKLMKPKGESYFEESYKIPILLRLTGIEMDRPARTESTDARFALYYRTIAHGFNPTDMAANFKQVETDIKAGDFHHAIALLNKILQADPNNLTALEQRMRCFYFKRAFIRADAEAGEILRKQPNNVLALNIRGLYNFEAQNYTVALDYFNKAIAADAKDPRPLFNRVRVLTRQKEYTAALKDLDKLRVLAPDVSEYIAGRGNVYLAMKNWEEAALNYMEAVILDEKNYPARYNLILSLDQLGQTQTANIHHTWLIKNAPNYGGLKSLEGRNASLAKSATTEVEEGKMIEKINSLLDELENGTSSIQAFLRSPKTSNKTEALEQLHNARGKIYKIISDADQIQYISRELLNNGSSKSPEVRQRLEKLIDRAKQYKLIAEQHKKSCEENIKKLQGYL